MSSQRVTVRVVTKTRYVDAASQREHYDALQPVREIMSTPGDMEPDSVYVEKLRNIFSGSMYVGVPYEPTMITGLVYLGTQANAENLDCLKRLKIKHVLNCAGLPESLYHSRAARYKGSGVQYTELPIDDSEWFNIMGFFGHATGCIENALLKQERILIHCTGVSRSGAIAMAYLLKSGKRLLDAATDLKKLRRVALCNEGFMVQLVSYARARGMLDPAPHDVKAPAYGRAIDAQRIKYAHLPDYLYTYGDKISSVYR